MVPASSGTAIYVKELISSLSEKEVEVTLVAPPYSKKVQNLPFDFIPIDMKKPTSVNFLTGLTLKAPKLKLTKSAIIHTQRPDEMFPFAVFWRQNPKICTLHGIPAQGIKTRKSWFIYSVYKLLEKYSLKRIDFLIAVDARAKSFYLKKYPFLRKKLKLIPNGVNTQLFKPQDPKEVKPMFGFNEDDKIILSIGRFSFEKRFDLLIKVFCDVKKEVENAKLVLVGQGPERKKLVELVRKIGMEDVEFLEPVEHERIPALMNCADMLVLCSMYEGMPTVVLEALACGVPVVATDVGDVGKIVEDGRTGQLVKADDYKNIKKAILKLLGEGKSVYKENCIEMAKSYSWESLSVRILGVYEESIKEKG